MKGLALLAVLATVAAAAPHPGPQATPAAQPAGPQPGRGGGRGRGAIQVMTLISAGWPDGGQIPVHYAQPGGDASPPFTWTNVPETAASFVLIAHDLDAATGSGVDDVLHWLLWNIPGTMRALGEHLPPGATLPDGTRQISATGPNYRGPAAPASGPPHHYVFELYALDTMLDVPAIGTTPAQTRAAVMEAMAGHIRGKGVYTGLFRRP